MCVHSQLLVVRTLNLLPSGGSAYPGPFLQASLCILVGSVAFSTEEVSLLSLGVSSPVDHAPQVSRMVVASGTGAP